MRQAGRPVPAVLVHLLRGGYHFAAGEVPRGPVWMHRVGLEWLFRLITELRRLAGRYLLHYLPYAIRRRRQAATA